MKTKYRYINDLLEWAFYTHDPRQNYFTDQPGRYCKILCKLVEQWGERTQDQFSWSSSAEVTSRRRQTDWCIIMAIVFSLLATLFLWPAPLAHPEAKIPLQLQILGMIWLAAAGFGFGGWCFGQPKAVHAERLDNFLEAVYEVVWAINEHKTGNRRNRHRTVRCILLTGYSYWDELFKDADSMLIGLALEVKKAEAGADPILGRLRAHYRSVHANAVKLGLAEKNPRTYFDRAANALEALMPADKPAAE